MAVIVKGSGGSSSAKYCTYFLETESGDTARLVYVEEEEILLTAKAENIEKGYTAITEDGVVVGNMTGSGTNLNACSVEFYIAKGDPNFPTYIGYTSVVNGQISYINNINATSYPFTIDNVLCGSVFYFEVNADGYDIAVENCTKVSTTYNYNAILIPQESTSVRIGVSGGK